MASQCDVMQMSVEAVLQGGTARRGPSLLLPLFIGGLIMAAVVSLPTESPWVRPLVPLGFVALIAISIWNAARIARNQRTEQELLQLAEEGVRLGKWDEAIRSMGALLGGGAQRPQVRLQAMIYLTGAWIRAGRFADVATLCEHLLQKAIFPPPMALSLRCVRVYAMLRDDRLSDAYEAVTQLRKDYPGGSGMLSVVEIYQLVKTGHYADALGMFELRREQMAQQLGHRSSDGWALAAASLLALGRTDEAKVCARKACLLSDASEIGRRFPECNSALELVGKGGTHAG